MSAIAEDRTEISIRLRPGRGCSAVLRLFPLICRFARFSTLSSSASDMRVTSARRRVVLAAGGGRRVVLKSSRLLRC
eukprot:5111589-Prymnesium_polylepis.2